MYRLSDWNFLRDNENVKKFEVIVSPTTRNNVLVIFTDERQEVWSYLIKVLTKYPDNTYVRHWNDYSVTTSKACIYAFGINKRLWNQMLCNIKYKKEVVNDKEMMTEVF